MPQRAHVRTEQRVRFPARDDGAEQAELPDGDGGDATGESNRGHHRRNTRGGCRRWGRDADRLIKYDDTP